MPEQYQYIPYTLEHGMSVKGTAADKYFIHIILIKLASSNDMQRLMGKPLFTSSCAVPFQVKGFSLYGLESS